MIDFKIPKDMMPHRSPLQNWAWHRFMFKGFLVRTIGAMKHFMYLGDLSLIEKKDLTTIDHLLESLLRRWDTSQKMTRERRVKNATDTTRTTDSS